MAVTNLRSLRCASAILALLNVTLFAIGAFLAFSASPDCPNAHRTPLGAVVLVAVVRLAYMVGAAKAQHATASTIVGHVFDRAVSSDAVIRKERRMRYRRWLWWTRFGMFVTVLQFLVAFYLMYIIAKDITYAVEGKACFLGQKAEHGRKKIITIAFVVLLWLVVVVQCIAGTEVLKWRSFYTTQDTAWKAHYREVFDHSIREALCCMGRIKYLSAPEEDEIYSVARLLGDLVAYRASGTGHLELLAGLALLQRPKQSPKKYSELIEAHDSCIEDAALFHKFSEAAYTGPLLDVGRNPILFPCAWLYRQGVLTPWSRSRRPVLEGDNWWRGHAAAFIKSVNISPEDLRRGRVKQAKREAAYFIVVCHDMKSIVIAVRGTETPEDLITDSLCRECELSESDLDGLINSDQLSLGVRETVRSTFPHFGHSGIVESARELFNQIDGHPGDEDDISEKYGFLSSLLGNGCEFEGYRVCIVGHSLGGAVAILLGIRLYARYPDLHVFAYGPLPCVDPVIAEACSDFVTSIVYNDEFSSRLSVNSILRLRTAAIAALSDDSSTNSAIVSKLARKLLSRKYKENDGNQNISPNHNISRVAPEIDEVSEKGKCTEQSVSLDDCKIFVFGYNEDGNPTSLDNSEESSSFSDCTSPFKDVHLPLKVTKFGEFAEVFLPGLIIHIVAEEKSNSPMWKSWMVEDRDGTYKAFIAERESFKDIVVSPYLFLDHLPWRCHYALQRVLEARKHQPLNSNSVNGEQLV